MNPNEASTDPGVEELLRLKSVSQSILDASNDIDNQIQILRLDQQNILKKFELLRTVDLPRAAKAHSKRWSTSFGAVLQATLPREIRDLIYSYLVTEHADDVHKNRHGMLGSGSPALIKIPTKPSMKKTEDQENRYSNTVEPIRCRYQSLISPEYFGEATGHEIAQVFYKSCNFALRAPNVLEDFLTVDIFGMGCVPSDLVRTLQIPIESPIFVDNWTWQVWKRADALPISDIGEVLEPEPLEKSTAGRILAGLAKLKRKHNAEVTIELRTGKQYVKQSFLFNVGIFVFRLRSEGIKVRVVQRRKGLRQKGVNAEKQKKYKWPGEDWTHVFDGTKQDWLAKAKRTELYEEVEDEE